MVSHVIPSKPLKFHYAIKVQHESILHPWENICENSSHLHRIKGKFHHDLLLTISLCTSQVQLGSLDFSHSWRANSETRILSLTPNWPTPRDCKTLKEPSDGLNPRQLKQPKHKHWASLLLPSDKHKDLDPEGATFLLPAVLKGISCNTVPPFFTNEKKKKGQKGNLWFSLQ